MNKVSIKHLDNQHNQWLRSLNFYKTEIAILKGILTEIAGKNTGTDAMKDVEHFENQFKVQNEQIDTLAHDIHVNVDAIGTQAQLPNASYVDGPLLTKHHKLGEQFDITEQVIRELIQSFRRFAEKWM